ncbi:MAG: OPT/YSL family transporter [Kiritimatiellae bacterium]|nr:OPT/YSL family transporter [Kiritimatiellia bacterium]
MPRTRQADAELEEFRAMMEVPTAFEDGFNIRSLMGAIFVGLVMVPGAMYMSLLAGQGIGSAAQWVTVILFLEAARRAHQSLSRAELYVLFYLASAVMAVPFSGLLWNQFLVQSNAAKAAGIAEHLPPWFAPQDPEILERRTFFQTAWLMPIGLIVFGVLVGRLNQLILGYGLFHITSDIEKLPFPMAPVGAQGILALAEGAEETESKETGKSWRWRVFSMGAGIGMLFGFFYLGLPTISGAFLKEPLMMFPIPFLDWTRRTGSFLPAVATGLSFDLGHVVFGMVMPFGAMVGSFFGLLFTFALNPILQRCGALPGWVLGDSTIETLFKNRVDFYFSFSMGLAFAIAGAGIFQVVRRLRQRRREEDRTAASAEARAARKRAMQERGDIPMVWVVLAYVLSTGSYILVSGWLLDWHGGALIMFAVIGFGYAPIMTYVRVRLEGMVGQTVHVPMVMEAARILCGYRGAAIWFVPTPQPEIQTFAVQYRQAELTGTSFKSIWKAQIFLMPIILIGSIFFANFIWGMGPIPSARFPYTEVMWEFTARNQCIMYSATMGGFSLFEEAFKPAIIAIGMAAGILGFAVFGCFSLPTLFLYGAVRGMDQTLPHTVVPQFLGALLGHFYFRRRFGKQWRRYIPVFAAGFSCGAGLITILGVGFTFLKNAVIQLPF